MNGHELLEKLGLVDEKYITEADAKPRRRRWRGVAAVLCLVVALGIILPQLGGRSGPGDGSGNKGDGPSDFMRYEGPILPLTVWEETPLTADRHLTLDFGRYGDGDVETRTALCLRDSYVLANPTEEDITSTLSYPVIDSFHEMQYVDVTVDGAAIKTDLRAGHYAGSFQGAGDTNTTSINLDYAHSWEGFRALLQDGSYMDRVQTEVPALDVPIIVYEITDARCDPPEGAAAQLNFAFDLPEDLLCLTYGFNGGYYNPYGGHNERQFHIRQPNDPLPDEPHYLMFVGRDIDGYTMQGYYFDGSSEGKELDATATVTRYEASLGEMLDFFAATYYDDFLESTRVDRAGQPTVSLEIYQEQVRRHFALYGVTGTEAKERYNDGMLGLIISEVFHHQRVLYHTFAVTVPAGESVTVEAATIKRPSHDFAGTGGKNQGVDGYDMVTQLGSPLTFTGQSAAIAGYDFIDIVRQNFGFDLAGGVTEVDLDMARKHYYIEIREKE